jgi:hypothetical protein
MELTVSPETRSIAGILLLTVPAVQSGGLYLYAVLRKRIGLTPFQHAFHRAGHAHAGVLVILGLVVQLYADAAAPDGIVGTVARLGVPLAAILMPAGFFLAAMGDGRVAPNRLVWLLYLGAATLAAGAVALGASLLLG